MGISRTTAERAELRVRPTISGDRTRFSAIVLLASLLATGCATAVSDGAGGVGGAAGVGGTGGVGGGTGGTGGAMFDCDDGTMSDLNSATCGACLECTISGPCEAELNACDNSTECTQFVDCLNGCSGQGDIDACIQQCVDTLPEGTNLFLALQTCQACECPNNCQGFSSCPM